MLLHWVFSWWQWVRTLWSGHPVTERELYNIDEADEEQILATTEVPLSPKTTQWARKIMSLPELPFAYRPEVRHQLFMKHPVVWEIMAHDEVADVERAFFRYCAHQSTWRLLPFYLQTSGSQVTWAQCWSWATWSPASGKVPGQPLLSLSHLVIQFMHQHPTHTALAQLWQQVQQHKFEL